MGKIRFSNPGYNLRCPYPMCKKSKIVSEYDQELPQSQTADKPMAPRGRATQQSWHREEEPHNN